MACQTLQSIGSKGYNLFSQGRQLASRVGGQAANLGVSVFRAATSFVDEKIIRLNKKNLYAGMSVWGLLSFANNVSSYFNYYGTPSWTPLINAVPCLFMYAYGLQGFSGEYQKETAKDSIATQPSIEQPESNQAIKERMIEAGYFPQENRASGEVVLVLWSNDSEDELSAFALKGSSDKAKLSRASFITLNRKYRIELVVKGGLDAIRAACMRIREEGCSLSHIVIGRHGSARSVGLENGESLSVDTIRNTMFPGFNPQGHILFESCQTGSPAGIGHRMSEVFPQASIYAPGNSSYAAKTLLYLDAEGNPGIVQLDFNRDILLTRIFRNGGEFSLPITDAKYIADEQFRRPLIEACNRRMESLRLEQEQHLKYREEERASPSSNAAHIHAE